MVAHPRILVRRAKNNPVPLFLFGVLCYSIVMIYHSLSYSQEARLFPLTTSVLLIVMILSKLLITHFDEYIDISVSGLATQTVERSQGLSGQRDSDATRLRREFEMVGWIITYVVATFLFGFLSTLLLVPVFVYAYERDHWIAVYAFVVGFVLFYGFVYLLSARTWEGIVWTLLF